MNMISTLFLTLIICASFWCNMCASYLLEVPEPIVLEVAIPVASRFSSLSDFVTQHHNGQVQVTVSNTHGDIGQQHGAELMKILWDLECKSLQALDGATLNTDQLVAFAVRHTAGNSGKHCKTGKQFLSTLPMCAMGYAFGFLLPWAIVSAGKHV